MLMQKLLTNPAKDALYVLSEKGLHQIADGVRSEKALWRLPEDSKASLIAVAAIGKSYALLGDSLKQVYLISLADGAVLQSYRSEKCPMCMLIEVEDEEKVVGLIADRFGDVTRAVFNLTASTLERSVVVGHVSVITDMSLANGLLLTADRDEKLRVSRLSAPHIIEAFLLGHTEYISSACILADTQRVISVSGDGTARLWRLDSEDSSQGKSLLDTFQFNAQQYGRKIKVERVVSREEKEGEQVEEEVEESEQDVVEPLFVMQSGDEVVVAFDRSCKLCFLKVQDDRLVFSRTMEFPGAHTVISILQATGSLMVLTCTKDLKGYELHGDAVESLGQCPEGLSSWLEGQLWKGSMRKDCHGLFARHTKSKRAAAEATAADDSELDD